MSPFPDEILGALRDHFGREVRLLARRDLGGGCISEAARLETSEGVFFAKWQADGARDLFTAEAAGLRALAGASSGLVVPRPLVVGPRFLVLPFLEAGRRVPDFDERLGRGLAALHECTAPAFGFEADNYCGATPQRNGWMPDWPGFYGERRLRPLVSVLRSRGVLVSSGAAVFERVIERLPALVGLSEAPALIHGDLWSGNLLVTAEGGPALIDPAVSFSHREAELGMMVLFGGFSRRVFEAYDEARPLAPGWRERLPLYSLYHVLNHAVLFGGGYVGQALELARRYA